MFDDLRHGVRMLIKSPGYSSGALLVLALGLSGVTATFSTLYAVILQPLPYSRPDRLVMGRATFDGVVNPFVAGPDYVDYRERSRSFSSLDAYLFRPLDVTVVVAGRAERTEGQLATPGLLSALGVTMAAGRTFTAEDGRDGAPPVAIVSHAFWESHLSGQRDLAGRPLLVDGTACEVVGVTPPGFRFVGDASVWLPLRPQALGPRRYSNWLLIGRLRDGVTLAQAQSEVDLIAAQLAKAYPDTNAHKALLLSPLRSALAEHYRSSFGLLCAGAAAILLIAWANAAGLLLARGARRRSELSVRAALGASRWRLMRLLLIEALALAGAACAVSLLLAGWLQQGLLRLMPIDALLLGDVGLPPPVLVFVLATTVLTGAAFGLVPAWRARQVDLSQDLRAGGRGTVRQGVRLRAGLVAGQVAVSFVLLVVAGLLIRSFGSLQRAEPGFDHRNLLTAEVPLPPLGFPDEKRAAFFIELLERVRSLPGVVSAAAVSQLPLRDPYNNVRIDAAGAPPASPEQGGDGYQRLVLPGYFQTMGIPLLAGRDVQPSDSIGSRRVVVLSRRLAEALFPGRDPLGQGVVIDGATDVTWDVVGVVGDVKQDDLRQDAASRGSFYRAYGQQSPASMRLAIRVAGDPSAVVSAIRATLQRMAPDVPLSGVRTMEAIMVGSTVSERALSVYLATFSLLAVTLAAVGLYALLAYVVAQRQREIGIRMALGARTSDVARRIVSEAVALGGAGMAVGVPAAFAVSRLLRAQLYGVTPFDPPTLAASAALLMAVTMLAAFFPARRAAKVHPTVALRQD